MQDTADYMTLGICQITNFSISKRKTRGIFPVYIRATSSFYIFSDSSMAFTNHSTEDGYSKIGVRWQIKVLNDTLQKHIYKVCHKFD